MSDRKHQKQKGRLEIAVRPNHHAADQVQAQVAKVGANQGLPAHGGVCDKRISAQAMATSDHCSFGNGGHG